MFNHQVPIYQVKKPVQLLLRGAGLYCDKNCYAELCVAILNTLVTTLGEQHVRKFVWGTKFWDN